ncbi:MAG: indolepyruvate ferredoxin oxidoreductase subunit alpha, partial [Burkholderiales bacterium]
MKSQMWLLDPRPSLPSLVHMVEQGFELSEASSTPVMLEMRIRACHVHGSFVTAENRPPPFTLRQALEAPRRETGRIVLPPASFAHEHEKIESRWPRAVQFIRECGLNERFDGDVPGLGIIMQGGMYNGVIRALQSLGLADHFGNTRIPLYVLNVTYPLLDDEVVEFCRHRKAVLMVEEGQPDYIEQNVHAILRKAGVHTPLAGKDVLPMAGEYTPQVLTAGIEAFVRAHLPALLAPTQPITVHRPGRALAGVVPPRPPGFCTGCPERPIFSAMTLVQRELGEHHIAADIGCHLFSILPPFNLGSTTMGYGLGASSASAFSVPSGRRAISVMGDGGFWHNGLASGIGNAVYNKSDGVIVIVDNHYASATGGQDVPSSRARSEARSTNHPIEDAVRGVGVQWVRRVDHTYDVGRMRDVLREALTTREPGPKVVIAQSECMLNRQRRERPLARAAIGAGRRVVSERFGVDADVCTGDHACMRLSGCPSLTLRPSDDPLREDPVAYVDSSCVGCGHCGEVADAAVLCPSFYRAELVHHAHAWERARDRFRRAVIGWLQRRRSARLARCAF